MIAAIERFVEERPACILERDDAGNLTVSLRDASASGRPIYLTAHLDHPAFVVERIISDTTLEIAFRGGVMDDYFPDAKVRLHTADAASTTGKIVGPMDATQESPFKHYECELDEPANAVLGDIVNWAFPEASIGQTPPETGADWPGAGSLLSTHACDDLAAVAAALDTLDRVIESSDDTNPPPDVRLLFTLAEEIGFVGAIGACKLDTIPSNARVIALENSRAFAEAPIGGGPIVRVGDRLSVFSPDLTAQVSKVAEDLSGGPATPKASQKNVANNWKWQRKLMAGGACEATAYTAYGLEATCVCLPLGNYHNMADLTAVQAGTNTDTPRVGPEYIALSDYDGLVDLLTACAQRLGSADAPSTITERLEKLWTERKFVLDSLKPS